MVEFYRIQGIIEGALVNDTVQALSVGKEVSYKLNPAGADLEGVVWSFEHKGLKTRNGVDFITLVNPNPVIKDGIATFTVNINNEESKVGDDAIKDMISLVATFPAELDDRVIESDYVTVESEILEVGIVDSTLTIIENVTQFTAVDYINLTGVQPEPKIVVEGNESNQGTGAYSEKEIHKSAKFVYTDELDLLAIVNARGLDDQDVVKDIKDYGFEGYSYTFEFVEEFLGTDGRTKQASFIEFTDELNSKIKVKDVLDGEFAGQDRISAINRTPMIKVQLVSDANQAVIATSYIMCKILAEEVVVNPLVVKVNAGDIAYSELFAAKPTGLKVDWDVVNNDIYDVLGLTHEQFQEKYTDATITKETNNKPLDNMGKLVLDYGNDQVDTEDFAVKISATNKWSKLDGALTKRGTYVWTYEITKADRRPVHIEYTFNIVMETILPEFERGYVSTPDDIMDVKGREVMTQAGVKRHEMSTRLSEAFVSYLDGFEDKFEDYAFEDYASVGYDFRQAKSIMSDSAEIVSNQDKSDIDQAISQTLKLIRPIADKPWSFPIEFVVSFPNQDELVKPFTVKFTNPLVVTVADLKLKTLDQKTEVDVNDFVTITFNDHVVYDKEGWDNVLKAKYGIANFRIENAKILPATGGYLDFSSTTFIWNNGGADRITDFTGATIDVSVSASYDDGPNYARRVNTKNVTILSKENSK